MKAITRIEYGSPEVLRIEELPIPALKENEILVKVHATTVNRTDCGILTGKPFVIQFFTGLRKPSHLVPGTDFAGEVVKIGAAVKNFKVGDKVWGLDDEGLQSHAQYMSIEEEKAVFKIPEHFSFEEVVACAEGAHYAFYGLDKMPLEENASVLVNGATGAIGSASLQLLKSKNIYVTAVCNSKNIALIKSLGADKVYNYETEDFREDTERYDLVLDAVGKSRFTLCKHLLKEKGVYTSTELGKAGENLYLPFLTLFSKKKVKFPIPFNAKRSLSHINALLAQGKFKPIIDRFYSMSEIKDAYAYVMSGQKTGNVILKIDHD